MGAEYPLFRLLSGAIPHGGLRAFWKHFPDHQELSRSFADAVISFQLRHRFDLVKITPHSSYCVRDYGQEDCYDGDWLGRQSYGQPIIRSPRQWRNLPLLSQDQGEFGAHAACAAHVVDALAKATPVVTTIFSPLSQARRLAGNETLLEHMRLFPEDVRAGLEILAQNTINHVKELQKRGIHGIFYVLQEQDFLTLGESDECAGALNLAILQSVRAPLRMLHVHGKVESILPYLDYPANVLHWHEVQGCEMRSLEAVSARFSGIVSGGVEWPRAGLCPKDAGKACRDLRERMAGKPYLLSGNCVLPVNTASEVIDHCI